MNKKRILISMVEVGNGHKSPSNAIKKSIEKLYPKKYDVKVIDLMKHVNSEKTFLLHQNFWIKFALKFPNIFKILFKLTDNKFCSSLQILFLNDLYKKTKNFLNNNRYDLHVATHSSCVNALAHNKNIINSPLISIDTDPFDVHYFWINDNIDNCIVFSDLVKKSYIKKGINENKIITFNQSYPIDYKHSLKVISKKEIRKKIGLKDKLTMLVFMGAEGVGNMKKLTLSIINSNLDYQILIICGRNEKLKNELEKIEISKDSKIDLKILGFVDNTQDFIQASDIVIGKPGASQTFEVLLKRKPLIYTTYMANEYHTLRFVVDNGIGWYVKNKKKLIDLLKNLEKNQNLITQASKNIPKIYSCSDDIARFLIKQIKSKKFPEIKKI